MVDCVLNMMAETKRIEFRVAEVNRYLMCHWNTLMYGWPKTDSKGVNVKELTGDPNGKNFRGCQSEFTKKTEGYKNCKSKPAFKDNPERKEFRQLYDMEPRQPMDMLPAGCSWLPGAAVGQESAAAAAVAVASPESSRKHRGSLDERTRSKLQTDDKQRKRVTKEDSAAPMGLPVGGLATVRSVEKVPEDDLGAVILSGLRGKLQPAQLDDLNAVYSAAYVSGEGTAARVCGLVQSCCESLGIACVIKELVRILPAEAQLLDRAITLTRGNGWWGGKETELGQLAESHPWHTLELVAGAAEQMVAALGEEKMRQALAEVVQHYAQGEMHAGR